MSSLRDRLLQKLDVTSGCWVWAGWVDRYGYGRIRPGPGMSRVRAHRAAWVEFVGPILPDTPCVLHRCDNRRCCNPAHLFLGTIADNNADKAAKGRAPHGEANPVAKLSRTEVVTIRGLIRAGGVPQKDIARRFGVAKSVITNIKQGKTWARTV